MARAPKLLVALHQRSLRTLAAHQRRRARTLGVDAPHTAALCALQRFGSAIHLNVHFHVVAPDAVFNFVCSDGLKGLKSPTASAVPRLSFNRQVTSMRFATLVTRYELIKLTP